MKAKITKGQNIYEKGLFKVDIQNKIWGIREQEQSKRFSKIPIDDIECIEYFKEYPCFDYDESRECGVMSIEHLHSFISFIKNYEI